MQNLYEISYFLKADSLEEAEETLNTMRKRLEDKGAMVTDSSRPEKRRLGYDIKGRSEAYFGALKFTAKDGQGASLGETLEGQKKILRFMFVKAKKEEVRRKRESRPERKIPAEPATDIEVIDKKLDEILGR